MKSLFGSGEYQSEVAGKLLSILDSPSTQTIYKEYDSVKKLFETFDRANGNYNKHFAEDVLQLLKVIREWIVKHQNVAKKDYFFILFIFLKLREYCFLFLF